MQRTTVARWEQGISAPLPWNRPPLARVLQLTPDELADILDGDEDGGNDTQRRDVLKLGVAAVLGPVELARQLEEAAAEAVGFTARVGTSAVGRGVLDHLQVAIADVARAYSRERPNELFGRVLAYRRQVDRLLAAPRTLREARELYTCAGWLSEILAWASHDAGSAMAADAYCVDAYEHADQAGHDELCAWAMDARASIAMYGGRPDAAYEAALAGLAKAPKKHPLTVRLHAQAARACAGLGRHGEFQRAFAAARDGYDRLPSRTPDRFGKDTSKLAAYAITSYAATSYVWLGSPDRARSHAEAALAEHEAAARRDRSPTREAIARIDLALCLAELDEPDEAARLGRQALSSGRVVDSVLRRAEDLTDAMRRHQPEAAPTEALTDSLCAARQRRREEVG